MFLGQKHVFDNLKLKNMFFQAKTCFSIVNACQKYVFNNVKLKNMFLQRKHVFQLFQLVKNMFLNQKHGFEPKTYFSQAL